MYISSKVNKEINKKDSDANKLRSLMSLCWRLFRVRFEAPVNKRKNVGPKFHNPLISGQLEFKRAVQSLGQCCKALRERPPIWERRTDIRMRAVVTSLSKPNHKCKEASSARLGGLLRWFVGWPQFLIHVEFSVVFGCPSKLEFPASRILSSVACRIAVSKRIR